MPGSDEVMGIATEKQVRGKTLPLIGFLADGRLDGRRSKKK